MQTEVRAEAAEQDLLLRALPEDSERGLDRGARGGGVMGYTEINTACDLCNCYWGSPGNRACDVEFTHRWGRPFIPPECPREYPSSEDKHLTRTDLMGRIRRVELDMKIFKELSVNGGEKVGHLAESIQEMPDAVSTRLRKLKRRGIVRQSMTRGGHKWALSLRAARGA